MQASIVLGLSFGDEGKGATVNYLCHKFKDENPLVIRFNGGHQAGHTVVYNDQRHVFSNFGSGTLQGVPTYWSELCTFDPLAAMREYDALRTLGHTPKLFVHPQAPLVTPFDIGHNRVLEEQQQHGSCGVGFGSTLLRNESMYKLWVSDLFYPQIFKIKLKGVVEYYRERNMLGPDWEEFYHAYVGAALQARDIIIREINFLDYGHLIFEGAQGILLDMDFGFFPHVTRSNTTSKNAHWMWKNYFSQFSFPPPELYYVTRTYQTRHGIGPMTNEGKCVPLINNENETNQLHHWQGAFRTGMLDLELLHYALQADSFFSLGCQSTLVVTCADQTGMNFPFAMGAEVKHGLAELVANLGYKFKQVIVSDNPDSTLCKREHSLLLNKITSN